MKILHAANFPLHMHLCHSRFSEIHQNNWIQIKNTQKQLINTCGIKSKQNITKFPKISLLVMWVIFSFGRENARITRVIPCRAGVIMICWAVNRPRGRIIKWFLRNKHPTANYVHDNLFRWVNKSCDSVKEIDKFRVAEGQGDLLGDLLI